VDPILAVPGVRSALERTGVPIVAVSPIVGGQALKGPAAKLMRERGLEPGVKALVDHYGGLLSGLVVDEADAEAARELRSTGLPVQVTRTIMTANEDRVRLAAETLDFARSLRGGARRAAS
jgi:LPPG:FO 2-phospho-L-lactate transferase